MKKILLTGGRAPATLELARLFHAAGHRVFVAESLPWHLCRASRSVEKSFRVPAPNHNPAFFVDALLNIVRQQKIDLLIPTCEETFYVAMGRDHLQTCCRVFTTDLARLQTLHNKWTFIQQALHHNLSVPRTSLITRPRQVEELLRANHNLVLKPVYSRFAAKTVILPQTERDIPRQAISEQQPWVAQEFVPGRQLCTYSIAHAGKLSAHSCYAAEFTAGHGATLVFQAENHPAILAWVTKFVGREQFTGQIAFDFIEREGGQVLALECNPRLTSGIHLFDQPQQITEAFMVCLPEMVTPAPGRSSMLALPMLLYSLPATRSLKRLTCWTKTFFAGRDVLFRLDDPAPWLVMQWLATGHLIYQSFKYGVSLPEASTLDIEWNGP